MADSTEAIHTWFNLTYANYLVVPRSVLQSMPDDWQVRFVVCLEEMERVFGHLDWPSYDVRALAREKEHIHPYIACEECAGKGTVDGHECQACEGEGELPDPEGPRYETAEEVGFRTDPIPHYSRGRTRIEPRLAA
jgi:hypothetical protein